MSVGKRNLGLVAVIVTDSASVRWTRASTITGSGNISGAPLFVNAAGGDYTLQEGSPCIDTGTNQTWMVGAKDLAGNNRMLYGGVAGKTSAPIVDMGAYEIYVPPKGTVVILK